MSPTLWLRSTRGSRRGAYWASMWAAYGITFLKFVDVEGAMGTNVQLLFFLAPGSFSGG